MNKLNDDFDPNDFVGEFEGEWDQEEPVLDSDDVPVFDRGRVRDSLSIEGCFDDPEKF